MVPTMHYILKMPLIFGISMLCTALQFPLQEGDSAANCLDPTLAEQDHPEASAATQGRCSQRKRLLAPGIRNDFSDPLRFRRSPFRPHQPPSAHPFREASASLYVPTRRGRCPHRSWSRKVGPLVAGPRIRYATAPGRCIQSSVWKWVCNRTCNRRLYLRSISQLLTPYEIPRGCVFLSFLALLHGCLIRLFFFCCRREISFQPIWNIELTKEHYDLLH